MFLRCFVGLYLQLYLTSRDDQSRRDRVCTGFCLSTGFCGTKSSLHGLLVAHALVANCQARWGREGMQPHDRKKEGSGKAHNLTNQCSGVASSRTPLQLLQIASRALLTMV